MDSCQNQLETGYVVVYALSEQHHAAISVRSDNATRATKPAITSFFQITYSPLAIDEPVQVWVEQNF